jgi:hypothetical protein
VLNSSQPGRAKDNNDSNDGNDSNDSNVNNDSRDHLDVIAVFAVVIVLHLAIDSDALAMEKFWITIGDLFLFGKFH